MSILGFYCSRLTNNKALYSNRNQIQNRYTFIFKLITKYYLISSYIFSFPNGESNLKKFIKTLEVELIQYITNLSASVVNTLSFLLVSFPLLP